MKHPEASQAEPWTAHRQAMPRAVARTLADPLRWRIVELLASEQLCVNHLAAELEAPQPLVSHHLKALRQAGVVATDPYRYWTYYRLRPDGLLALSGHLRGLATTAPSGIACRRPPDAASTPRPPLAAGEIQLARDRQLDPISRRTFAAVVVAAMAEWGIDLGKEFPKPLTDESSKPPMPW